MLNTRTVFIALVTLSIVLTYTAAEIYLPAMPMLQTWFGCTTTQLQSTVSIFMFGMTIAQFIGGPIIDRFSYRHIALSMCVIFILASIACALSVHLKTLIAARLFQAFSVGILAIIGRASLTRKFEPAETIRIYLFVSPMLALSLSFSPLIGGYLTWFFGWQSVFYFLAFIGVILGLLIYFFLFVEQNKFEAISIHPISIFKTYFSLFKDNSYTAAIYALSALFAQQLAYLTETPFIFHKLHYSSDKIGTFYIVLSLAFIFSSWQVKKLQLRFSYQFLVCAGFTAELLGVLWMLLVSLGQINYAYEIILPSIIVGIGNGILVPLLTGKAISLFPKKAGYASGFMSAMTLLASAIVTAFVHQITQGSVMLLATFMGVLILTGFSLFIVFNKKIQPFKPT